MRLHSRHKNIKTGKVFELQLIQQPQKDKRGNTEQWLILKNPLQKYPISVSREDFESEYEPE